MIEKNEIYLFFYKKNTFNIIITFTLSISNKSWTTFSFLPLSFLSATFPFLELGELLLLTLLNGEGVPFLNGEENSLLWEFEDFFPSEEVLGEILLGEDSEIAGDGWELRLFWNSLLGSGLDFSTNLSDSGVARELLEPKT